MLRFVPYVWKCLWGHRARTMLTVSGAAVAMFVFCFVGSIQEGLARLTADRSSQQSLIVFQENRFCPTTSRLPQDYGRQIQEIPGVKEVMPIQVWTNNCRASLDIVVFHGVPPKQLRQARDLTLIAGDWSQFESRRDAAIVGKSVAQRRGLAVGDQFSIGELSVQVAGIFESAVPSEESLIYSSLDFLQNTRGLAGAGVVTQHEVLLHDGADADAVARQIDAKLRSGVVATTTRQKGTFQLSTLSDLVDLIGFAHWLGYACLGLVLSLVATTTVMAVQDRVKEHAVLQTLGFRPSAVFRLVLAETLLLCVAGGVSGAVLALAVLAFSGLSVGAEGVAIAFRPSWQLAWTATAVSIVVGLLAGILPAWQAATTPIVPALRDA